MYLEQFPAERFSAENTQAFSYSAGKMACREMLADVCDAVDLEGVNAQKFSGLYVNRDSEGPLIIRLGGIQGSSRTSQQRYAAYQIAAANPNNPVLHMDLPSHGKSDLVSPGQRLEMFARARSVKIAASQAQAIMNFLPQTKECIVVGDSFGAQLAPDVATELKLLGAQPCMTIGFEMTGLSGYYNFNMLKKLFIGGRSGGQHKYHEGVANKRLDESYRQFKNQLHELGHDEFTYTASTLFKRDALFVASIFFRSPLTSETGWQSIERALDTNKDMRIALVTGGVSRICERTRIQRGIDRLHRVNSDRLVWDLWPNDSHSMSIAEQQPRSAAYVAARVQRLLADRREPA